MKISINVLYHDIKVGPPTMTKFYEKYVIILQIIYKLVFTIFPPGMKRPGGPTLRIPNV